MGIGFNLFTGGSNKLLPAEEAQILKEWGEKAKIVRFKYCIVAEN